MKQRHFWLLNIALLLLLTAGCKDKNNFSNLQLNIQGLQNLGGNFDYEGWVMVNGTPQSTGVFTVDDNGNMSKTSFEVNSDDLSAATAFILTIEPVPDNDPAPSSTHLMAGDFSAGSASLSVGHAAAFGTDFTAASGKYILATPTNGAGTNEKSGVWWLDPTAGPGPTLNLTTLPAGWKYEGWALIDGVPLSTGKFTSVSGADAAAPFSDSAMSAPPFPGEDFLMNAPAGVTLPTDLSGMTVVISVEPDPDNAAGPFLLKPLIGNVPAAAADHTLYDMTNNAANTNPTGTATR